MSLATVPDRETVRSPRTLGALALLALVLFATFVALGTWQVERLAWKRDLIERVEQRVQAPPTAAPTRAEWRRITAKADEYRHVRLVGTLLHERQTLVWASTRYGIGYWVMTPLRLADGSSVLVNRGFVPPDWCGRDGRCAPGPAGEASVTGLLRMSETHVFLRRNDPAHERWYARDVQGIARARGLTDIAPYFVDADAAATAAAGPVWPQGGLTVVAFPNDHLAYLITWYLLALMVAVGAALAGYDEYRRRREAAPAQGRAEA